VSLAMLAVLMPQLRAYHPPAAATALLVTLGAYRMTGKTPLALIAGVVAVAVASELLNRIRPRRSR
jgi:CBS-domain-containing membrane protein